MKYYINLIKRKKFGILAFCIFLALLGIFLILINYMEFLSEGLQFTDNSAIATTTGSSLLIILLSQTNLGMLAIGIFNIYIALVHLPHITADAQDDSDYIVESRDRKVYVKFKNNEFLLNKETLSPTHFFFKDKNNKFVSVTRGYQIYNYIKAKYNSLTEREVDDNRVINQEDIRTKFDGIKVMSKEDKLKYISYNKIKNSYKPLSFILALFFFICTGFWLLGCLLVPENIISEIALFLICFIVGFSIFRYSGRSKTLYNKIMRNKMYMADCYSYDKKIDTCDEGTFYYIKVANNEYYLNNWFEISEKIYKKSDVINAKIIFFEDSSLGKMDLIVEI